MKSTNETIKDHIRTFLSEYKIRAGSRIIVAFSGGPDSTVLLSALREMTEYNFTLIGAYFDHGLRSTEELLTEKLIIKETAGALGIKLETGAAERNMLKIEAKRNGYSPEEAARNARYSFLNGLCEKYNADYIATGHNLDDNAETMLMRFITNSGTGGLSGIPDMRGNIIRPLSLVKREEIESCIKEKGLSVSIDSTNSERDFLRNKIRHDILPVINKHFPEFRQNVKLLSGKIRMDNNFILEESLRRVNWKKTEDGWSIDAAELFSMPLVLRIRSVYEKINELTKKPGRVRYIALFNAMSGAVPGNGKKLLRTGDFELISRRGHILLQRLVNHNKKSYLLYLETGMEYEVNGNYFILENFDRTFENRELSDDEVLVHVKFPALARNCREGDLISIENGHKSLKKLFSEWGVIQEDKNMMLVIEDGEGIAAVIGRHLSYKNKTAFGRSTEGETFQKILLKFR